MGRVLVGKRDEQVEADVLEWAGAVLGEQWPAGASIETVFKDGQVLCRLMNKLSPGAVKKINTSGSHFKFMENIQNFLKAAVAYGVSDADIFQTPDLYEKKDIAGVTNTIFQLGRQTWNHPEWKGPWLGTKPEPL